MRLSSVRFGVALAGALVLVCLLVGSGRALGVVADGRGYELVSPPEKNGGDVMLSNTRTRAAASGEAFGFASLVSFGDAQGTAISSDFLARRTSESWVTHGITPLQHPMSGVLIVSGPGDAIFEGEYAADLSAGVVRANAFPTSSPNVATVQNLFVRRDLLDPGAGSYELVSDSVIPIPPPPFQLYAGYKPTFVAGSADFRHVIFESIRNLTQDAVNAGLPQDDPDRDHKLYEWVEGRLRLVGVLPASEGGGLATRTVAGQGVSLPINQYAHDAISDDGSRIFFTDLDTNQLYVRVNGSSTVRINASEHSSPDPTPSPAQFRAATPDGLRVFFTSAEQLTDDDNGGRDLFRYDATAPADRRLSRLSVDQVPDDSHTPTVRGVLGVSDDGEWAYFIADGALVADMPPVEITTPVIYAWHAGEIRYVAKLFPSGLETGAAGEPNWSRLQRTSRVSPDGRHALFVTAEGDQVPAHDHGDCEGEPCRQVYVFSADANGGAGALVCVSCDPQDDAATASSAFAIFTGTGGSVLSSHVNRPLSADGRFAFFHTTQALVAEDFNDRNDVYEFDVPAGELRLLSTGRADASDAYFLDASMDGRDVFFASRDQLVGWDTDRSVDVYDARVGGGFPEPPPALPECVGRACQELAGLVPAFEGPSSSVVRGTGNARARKPARRCKRGKVRKRVHGKVRCVRKPRKRVGGRGR